jgi:FhuF 2Fe-2S C-terminal domain
VRREHVAGPGVQVEGVLGVQPQVAPPRQHAVGGSAGHGAQHVEAGGEQPEVAAELVDDEPGDEPLVAGVQHREGAVHGGEDPAPVDVADDDHGQASRAGQAHVGDVPVPQVDLGGTAGALTDHHVEPAAQVGQAGGDRCFQRRLEVLVVQRARVGERLAEQHDLAAGVAAGLEQHRVHRGLRLHPGGGGLHRLGAADLRAVGGDGRVQRHVLGLERRDLDPASSQPPAQASRQHALPGIRRRPRDQQCSRNHSAPHHHCARLAVPTMLPGPWPSAYGGLAMLDSLAALGPFFAVDWHPPGDAPAPPWRPFHVLADRPGPVVQGALLDRIASVRAALATAADRPAAEIDPRAAASAAHLGLVARLVAPALGAAVLGECVSLLPDGLWWQDTLGGPVPLSVPVPPPGGAVPPGDWAERLLTDVIAPVTEATSLLASLSGQVLWGNAASAVNAAACQVAVSRPALATGAWEAARALFASPWLRRERQPPGVAYRRSSCCLFYRLAPDAPSGRSAICGDCVLGAP